MEVWQLLQRYADCDMDVTDACIVLLAENNPGLKVLTTARKHFSFYLTRSGKTIRCEFPPA